MLKDSRSDTIKALCDTDFGPYRRPFTPNPDWMNADVMVVGTNPATPMRDEFSSFEEYWSGLTQNTDLYWQKYHSVHGGKSSKSTTNANLLLSLLSPLNVLVTNVVWYPVQKKKFIPRHEWDIGWDSLLKLYDIVKPKAVFCHGADAEKFAKSLYQLSDRYSSADDQTTNIAKDVLVLSYHHFSGQGLRSGTRFQPSTEFPIFAQAIHEHIAMYR